MKKKKMDFLFPLNLHHSQFPYKSCSHENWYDIKYQWMNSQKNRDLLKILTDALCANYLDFKNFSLILIKLNMFIYAGPSNLEICMKFTN